MELFGSKNEVNTEKTEKQKRLDDMMSQVEQIGDRLGKGIDEGIREGVSLLMAYGINTTGSCEGHDDWGTGGPYIDVESKEIQPLYEKVDKLPEQKDTDERDPERDAVRDQILELNLSERRKLIPLLEEFYRDREVSYDVKLYISALGNGWSRLENQGVEFQSIEKDKTRKAETLKKFQAEMKDFVDFVRMKYFESDKSEQSHTKESDKKFEREKSIQYIEAPSIERPVHPSLFLAGGITNCPEWQDDLVKKLNEKGLGISVFNPRRKEYPKGNPDAEKEQISWEYAKLREAKMLSFWFSAGSDNPIVLFELGSALERDVPVAVGVDPEYARKRDVEIQVSLRKKDVTIVNSLDDLADQISAMCKNFRGNA